MSIKHAPHKVIRQGQTSLQAWKQIDPSLNFLNLSVDSLQADLDEADQLWTELLALKAQVIDVRNRFKAVSLRIWEKLKRLRAGIRGRYGDDSIQYKLIGGTRKSERKPYTHREKKEER